MPLNAITSHDLGIANPYEDIFSPDGKKVELSSIREWIKTEQSYCCCFKNKIRDRSDLELALVKIGKFLHLFTEMEASVYKYWLRSDFIVPNRIAVEPCKKTLDIRCPNGNTIPVRLWDYQDSVCCFFREVTIILGTKNVHAKPDLILLLCRIGFQFTLRMKTGRADQDTHLVKALQLYTDILKTEAVLLYQPFRYFVSEYPRYPTFSLAKRAYKLKLDLVSMTVLPVLYRPGAAMCEKTEDHFTEELRKLAEGCE